MKTSNTINIQEPAVQELQSNRSCLRRSCASSCGCIVFLLALVLILLNVLSGSGVNETKDLPAQMPTDLEIYETNRIQHIRVSDTVPQGRLASVASTIPKFFLAGIYVSLGENAPSPVQNHYAGATEKQETKLANFQYLLRQPLAAPTEQIEIDWLHLPAEPKFIQSFYTTNLNKAGYEVSITASSQTRRDLFFEKGSVMGTILIRDTDDTRGTDSVSITLTLPRE